MRMLLAITLLISTLCWSSAFSGGTVENILFSSDALGERWVQVYLPEDYDPGGSTYYPAIYFLHGADGNHLGYPELISYLDNLIGTGQLDPVIAIKPDGSGCPWDPYWEGCGWVDSELQGNYETYLVEDVIGFGESHYRIIQSREKRAIMGHSMGAFGSMHAALKHPEMFIAVAALSGYPHFDELYNQHIDRIIGEQPGDPPYDYAPDDGLFTGGWFMFAGGFSPDSNTPPYLVDFPLDPSGDRIPLIWDRWLEFDPATIAVGLSAETAPAIYFDCGTNDGFLLHPVNEAFEVHLTALGIPHEFRSYVGGHWLAARLEIALEFIDAAFGGVAAAGRSEGGHDDGSIVYFDVENPSRGGVALRFETACTGPTVLEIFDVRGRLSHTVLAGDLPAGRHHIEWDSDGIPSGVYFVRLRAGGDAETRTVVVQ